MNWDEFITTLNQFKDYNNNELIKKAYDFGEKVFQGIKRLNGEPYLNHCLRTAINLASLKMDIPTICAGILHDSLEDGGLEREELEKNFGQEIAFLVEGVTKVSNIRYKEKNLEQAENLRRLILNISEDIRIALLKLADRLDNMRTLEFLPPEKRIRFALETQDIYAPLALRLGIYEWAGELDDLAFKFLQPTKYQEIVKLIEEKVKNGEEILQKVKKEIIDELKRKNVNLIDIQTRIKRPSSVYKKLQKKNYDIEQIYDILAMRIIVSTIEECYITLGIIHSLYRPILEEFDDYITYPKPNGYQSLHTTCYFNNKQYIEFQIRTKEIHQRNEEGVAAYFAYADYKQTKGYRKGKVIFADEDEIKLIQEMKKWKEIDSFEDFLKNLKTDFLKEKIYVFTPKGDVVELPAGSTPLDFAYKIHSDIGNSYAGARVNSKIVPINYELKTGDIVEIVTQKNRKPSPDWLRIVKTYGAKKKIRAYLRKHSAIFYQKKYKLEIVAKDRIGLLKDIADIIASRGLNIVSSKTKTKNNLARLFFEIKLNEKEELERLKEILKRRLPEIIKIEY